MAAMDLTLDVKEPQVLLHFPLDAGGFYWHQRVLLKKLAAGRWIGVSPDFGLEVVDLNVLRHRVLDRRAPFPLPEALTAYIFDPIGRADLERLRQRAKTMAIILSSEDPVELEAFSWVYADVSDPLFGGVAPEDAVSNGVIMGDLGIVDRDGENVFIIHMAEPRITAWKESRKGHLGDLRLLGDHRDSQGKRHLGFLEALALMRPTKFDDWGLAGPAVLFEYLTALKTAGIELSAYHLAWVRNSGVPPWMSIVHEHRILIEVIRIAIAVDQLDVANLLSFENLGRRLVQIETAVSRNPHAPDFSGLEVFMEAPISSAGQAQTLKFNEWVTCRLKDMANIKKQARLYNEEFRSRGRGAGGGGGHDGGAGGGRGDGGGDDRHRGRGGGRGDGTKGGRGRGAAGTSQGGAAGAAAEA